MDIKDPTELEKQERLVESPVHDFSSVETVVDFETAKSGDPHALIGTKIAQVYEIEKLLGAGGMSVVYKAKHVLLQQTVAIKFLSSESADGTAYRRFQREAQAASQLRHENIASVRDFGLTEKQQPFIVMDYVEGTPLSDVIESEGAIAADRAIAIASQVCLGMQNAHSHGVIHRDIKPANIILTRDAQGNEVARIVDFGIAKVVREEKEGTANLTQTGDVLGTPYYMSPEQCHGRKLDARSDIYSLGCVLHEMVTGRPPFHGGSILETIFKHTTDAYPGLAGASAPAGLEQVINKALDKESRFRHRDMGELHSDLQLVRNGEQLPASTRRDRQLEVLMRRGCAWLIDTALLACFAVALGCVVTHSFSPMEFSVQAVFEQLAPGISIFTEADTYAGLLFLLPVVFVVNTLYHAIMECSRIHATLGKRWMHLEVTKYDGAPVGFLQALLRHASKTVLMLFVGGMASLPCGLIAPMIGKTDGEIDPVVFLSIVLAITLAVVMFVAFLMRRRNQLPFDWITRCRVSMR